MVYSAVFIAFLLLSNFEAIEEKELLAVELVVDLAVSFDLDLRRIDMTRDIYGKVRILTPQLCAIAARYGYAPHDPDISFNGAHTLLLEIVTPLVAHLCPYEHQEVKATLAEAQYLIDLPLPQLRAAVQKWYSQNFEIVLQTSPLPRSNAEPITKPEPRAAVDQSPRVVRRYDLRARRYGWTPPARTPIDHIRAATVGVGRTNRPRLLLSSTASGEDLTRRDWLPSPTSSSESDTPPQDLRSHWDDSDSFYSPDAKPEAMGNKLRKGFRAMFLSSSQAI